MRYLFVAVTVAGMASPMVADANSGDLPPMWFELGATAMHYTPDKIDTNASMYHVETAPADHGLAAVGGRLRALVAVDDHWYFGMESDLAHFDGPTLAGTWIERGATMTTPITTAGSIEQLKPVIGVRAPRGRYWVAGELSPGLQIAQYETTNVPNSVEPWTQAWYVLEAHAVGSVWIAPRLSLTLETSIDLAHVDRMQAALMVGGHFDQR